MSLHLTKVIYYRIRQKQSFHKKTKTESQVKKSNVQTKSKRKAEWLEGATVVIAKNSSWEADISATNILRLLVITWLLFVDSHEFEQIGGCNNATANLALKTTFGETNF